MSHILGFDSFASRALMTAAPENPDEVNYFLRTLSNEFKPIIEVEKANIASQVGRSDADIWEINFARAAPYTHRPSISRYLNFYDVMDGISKITSILYGVKLERETPKVNEVWHS